MDTISYFKMQEIYPLYCDMSLVANSIEKQNNHVEIAVLGDLDELKLKTNQSPLSH